MPDLIFADSDRSDPQPERLIAPLAFVDLQIVYIVLQIVFCNIDSFMDTYSFQNLLRGCIVRD